MRIAWLSSARVDLIEAVDYVLPDNPSAALRLYEAIRAHVELLADQPGLGRPGRVPGTRELVVPRTPYLVAYTVDPGTQTLAVLRVLHGARRWPESFD